MYGLLCGWRVRYTTYNMETHCHMLLIPVSCSIMRQLMLYHLLQLKNQHSKVWTVKPHNSVSCITVIPPHTYVINAPIAENCLSYSHFLCAFVSKKTHTYMLWYRHHRVVTWQEASASISLTLQDRQDCIPTVASVHTLSRVNKIHMHLIRKEQPQCHLHRQGATYWNYPSSSLSKWTHFIWKPFSSTWTWCAEADVALPGQRDENIFSVCYLARRCVLLWFQQNQTSVFVWYDIFFYMYWLE